MQINNSSTNFKGLYDPNILITGATGYIGSNLTGKLANAGYNCIICSRNSQKTEYLKNVLRKINRNRIDKSLFSFINLDLTKPIQIKNFLRNNKPIDAIVHLGGLTSNAKSIENPRSNYDTNVAGSLNLFNSMLDCGINKVLFVSTGSTYGKINKTSKIKETQLQKPETPYARSKVMIEQILRDYERYGLQSMILRLFNVAGAQTNQDLGIGINVISVLMDRIKKDSIFTLMGNKYNTPDQTCIKDFLHISDTCNAITLALGKLFETGKGDIYNLGSGVGTSLGTIVDKSQKITHKNVKIRIIDNLETESPVLIVNNSKIKKDLKWQPQYDIDDILRSAWEWTVARK